MLKRLLTRLAVRQIYSRTGELHFRRWCLFWLPFFRIYLHQIAKPDQDRHLHSHPWHFVSVVLRGWYVELTERNPIDDRQETSGWIRLHVPGKIHWRFKHDFHKIDQVSKDGCWTLVFAIGLKSEWGFSVGNAVIPNQRYRELKKQGVGFDESL